VKDVVVFLSLWLQSFQFLSIFYFKGNQIVKDGWLFQGTFFICDNCLNWKKSLTLLHVFLSKIINQKSKKEVRISRNSIIFKAHSFFFIFFIVHITPQKFFCNSHVMFVIVQHKLFSGMKSNLIRLNGVLFIYSPKNSRVTWCIFSKKRTERYGGRETFSGKFCKKIGSLFVHA